MGQADFTSKSQATSQAGMDDPKDITTDADGSLTATDNFELTVTAVNDATSFR